MKPGRVPRRKSKPAGLRKNIRFTVYFADGKKIARQLRTPPGQLMTPSGVDQLLTEEAERVEQYFPGREFRLVPLRDGNFNFIEQVAARLVDLSVESAEG